MAPTFRAASTPLAGASATSAVVTRPTFATDDVVIALIYKENNAAVTAPTGFLPLGAVGVAGTQQWSYCFWKRATASEPTTYTFSWTGSTWRSGCALTFAGALTTAVPYDPDPAAVASAGRDTAGTVTPAVSIVTSQDDELLVWCATHWDTTAWTPPTGYTEAITTDSWLTAAYRVQAVKGSSGSVTGTATTSSQSQTARLFALRSTLPKVHRLFLPF